MEGIGYCFGYNGMANRSIYFFDFTESIGCDIKSMAADLDENSDWLHTTTLKIILFPNNP